MPDKRVTTHNDWERFSLKRGLQLNERILQMQRLRENLTGCLGCGRLSLKKCGLLNKGDRIAQHGNGPRFLIEGQPNSE